MTSYCTPILILHVATLPKFLLQCQVPFGQKHSRQQHVASKLAKRPTQYTQCTHRARTASDTPPHVRWCSDTPSRSMTGDLRRPPAAHCWQGTDPPVGGRACQCMSSPRAADPWTRSPRWYTASKCMGHTLHSCPALSSRTHCQRPKCKAGWRCRRGQRAPRGVSRVAAEDVDDGRKSG